MGKNKLDYKPLMIAVSGYIDNDVKKRGKKVGFNQIYEVPLGMREI